MMAAGKVTVRFTARQAELTRQAVADDMKTWLDLAAEEMQAAVGNEEHLAMHDAAWKLRLAADLLGVLEGPLGLPFRDQHEAEIARLAAMEPGERQAHFAERWASRSEGEALDAGLAARRAREVAVIAKAEADRLAATIAQEVRS